MVARPKRSGYATKRDARASCLSCTRIYDTMPCLLEIVVVVVVAVVVFVVVVAVAVGVVVVVVWFWRWM